METNYNPYNRIQLYMAKMACDYDMDLEHAGVSIAELAEQTEIPVSIIRNDLYVMLGFNEHIPFNINDECEEYDKLDDRYDLTGLLDDDFRGYRNKLKELFTAGRMDKVKFYYDSGETEIFTLPLKPGEYEAYLHFRNMKSSGALKSLFLIKDSFRFKSTLEVYETLEEITYAVKEGKSLQIKYLPRNRSGKIRNIKIKPLKIIYDTIDNEYAVLTIYKHAAEVFRLSNIVFVKTIEEKIEIPERDLKLIDNIDQVWGMNFTGRPVNIKVRFENFGDVWNKVHKNLAYRTKGILEEQDGYLYYEDTVYGIDAFRSWIYSFGSAAIVMEPASLREQIIKSLETRLAEY